MRRIASLLLALVATGLLVELGVRVVWFQTKAPDPTGIHQLVRVFRKQLPVLLGGPTGRELNRVAWEASYRERGLPVPEGGPREGYWGDRIQNTNPACGPLVSCTRDKLRPGAYEIDAQGFQYAGPVDAPFRVLVIGGSVAFGAYASSAAETYFAKLADGLAARGLPTRVSVLASGGWISSDELAAFLVRGVKVAPQVAVFLDGLNDITEQDYLEPPLRVATYRQNVTSAREAARALGIGAVFALQPWPDEKNRLTPIEERLVELTFAKQRETTREVRLRSYAEMRAALAALALLPETTFIDCSAALAGESATTFADYWHFSDPGHTLLARCLVDGIAPVLADYSGTVHVEASAVASDHAALRREAPGARKR
jgi:lysophospholipase L1-like esterase